MNILYITTNFSALTHTFITREVEQLRRLGCRVDLLSLRRSATDPVAENPECDLSGLRLVHPVSKGRILRCFLGSLVTKPGAFLKALRAATSDPDDKLRTRLVMIYQFMVATTQAEAVRAGGYDHMHAHFASPPTTMAMFLHFLTGVPFSFTGHAVDIHRDRSALRPKFAAAAGTVAISNYNLEYYRSLTSELPPVEIVHCGIVLERFPFLERTAPDGEIRILAVGRLVPKKGFGVLVDALGLLDRAGVAWRADIVGEGPLDAELKAAARAHGLDDRLVFHGSVEQERVRELLNGADVFALPSAAIKDGDVDGIPVSLMEAMACGCPVISTSVSGIPELVIDGKTGLLIPPGDPEALAAAVRRLISDPELHDVLAAGGRRHIEEEFDAAGSARRLKDFFAEIS